MNRIYRGLVQNTKKDRNHRDKRTVGGKKYLNKQNNVMTRIIMDYLLHNRKNVLRSLDMYKIILGGCSRKQKSGMCGEKKITER